jgi:leader peptidase (prepilin peptidase)/N-methyltransferase
LLVTPLLRWAVLVHSVPPEQPWRSRCGGPDPGRPRTGGPEPGRSETTGSEAGRPRAGFPAAGGGPDPGGPTDCPAAVGPDGGLAPLLPAARCGACGRRVGAPPYLLEAAALVAAGLVAVAVIGGGWSPGAAVALAGWAALAVALTFVDLAVHRLPDRLTLPAAVWVLAWLGVTAVGSPAATGTVTTGTAAGDPDWVRAAAAAVVCGLGFAAVTLVFGARGFGLGDAKMALGVGALLGWLGWTAVVAGLLLAFLGSGLVAAGLLVARRAGRRDTLPFGPFLAAGTLAGLAWVGLSG